MIVKVIRSSLKSVMQAHKVKAIDLVRAVQARYGEQAISQATVYAVSKGNGLPDERTADQILHALSDVTGKQFNLGDIFIWQPDATPEREA